MKPDELSMTCWAFATARRPDDPTYFFNAVTDRLMDRKKYQGSTLVEKLSSKQLSNILWAFAAANQRQVSLFTSLGKYMIDNNDFIKVPSAIGVYHYII